MATTPQSIDHLVPTIGKWDLSVPGRPIYCAPQAGYDKPFGICVSGIHFVEGEARVTVKILNSKKESDASGRILIGYRAPDADYLLVGIGGSTFAYTLYQYRSGIGWQPIVLCGDTDHIVPDKSYNISIHVKGQRLVFKEEDVTVLNIC